MSTPNSAQTLSSSGQRRRSSAINLDQVVFRDDGPQPGRKALQKLSNRLDKIREDALMALNASSLPLTVEDRYNYSSAFSFSTPPSFVGDDESDGPTSSDDESAAYHTDSQKAVERQRRNVDRVATSIRDAFIRFMCHPHSLGSYAAYINNTSKSDVAMITEYRCAFRNLTEACANR
jgi:hypothetical protein